MQTGLRNSRYIKSKKNELQSQMDWGKQVERTQYISE